MKRMWTEREVRSLAVKSVEETSNLKVFEGIVDKDGHKRFIEGDIDIETITGVTKAYGKWSLSGSHLMVVLCLDIADATTINTETKLAEIDLPSWIKDKIVPLYLTYVSYNGFPTIGPGTDTTFKANFRKVLDDIMAIYTWGGNYTSQRDEHVRIQFDLLIDDE